MANVQPISTGPGKLIFPENATPANLSASGGTLALAAGGTNGNIALTPTGNGWTQAASSLLSLGLSSNFPAAKFVRMTLDTSVGPPKGDILAFDGGASTFIPLVLRGSVVYVGNGNFGAGGNNNPAYAVDATGDINASGVFRKGGAAGISATVPLAKLTTGGTNGSLTIQGGIITAVVNPT